MSYQRWNPSNWYVFQYARDDDRLELACWYAGGPHISLMYDEQSIEGIDEVRLAKLMSPAPRESIAELLEYVREWCADVREERNAGGGK